jgi:hypothetical protein
MGKAGFDPSSEVKVVGLLDEVGAVARSNKLLNRRQAQDSYQSVLGPKKVNAKPIGNIHFNHF